MKIQEKIELLVKSIREKKSIKISALELSGSPRLYYRVYFEDDETLIAAYSENVEETKTFIYFAQIFEQLKFRTPRVFAISENEKLYIIEDVGNKNLLSFLSDHKSNKHYSEILIDKYEQTLRCLVNFQIDSYNRIDFNNCYFKQAFDSEIVLWDLNYFKYYFLKLVLSNFNEAKLEADFQVIKEYIREIPSDYFMYRDFQARNIHIKDGELYFIDFQGGMKGPLQYDVASLLYQAKAGLSENERKQLLEYYIDLVSEKIKIDRNEFKKQFLVILFLRILQTLGAYGYRGLYERKPHFISSIPPALKNLRDILEQVGEIIEIPLLHSLLEKLTTNETILKFDTMNKLTVTVNSFSYKRGIPTDVSGNGGGFVFDCRAIPNPGKYDEYKQLTGMDKPVIDFLDNTPEMADFLNNVYSLVSQSTKRYIERNFSSLMVNFGCTGGQHRSVYAAEHLVAYLKNNFDVLVELRHLEQEK